MKRLSDEEIAFCIKDTECYWQEENKRLDMQIEASSRQFELQLLRLITEARFQGKEAVAVKFEGLLEEYRWNQRSIH